MTAMDIRAKDDFIEVTIVLLDLWRERIHYLAEQLAQSSRTDRTLLNDRLCALDRKRRRLTRRLKEAGHTTSPDWPKLRNELDQAVNDFQERAARVNDAVSMPRRAALHR